MYYIITGAKYNANSVLSLLLLKVATTSNLIIDNLQINSRNILRENCKFLIKTKTYTTCLISFTNPCSAKEINTLCTSRDMFCL